MTVSLDLLDEDGTFIKTLSGLVGGDGGLRGWTHPKRGAGAGTLTIANDHADYAALYRGRIIRCNLDGTPVFAWILQHRQAGRLDPDGADGKVTIWEGPGILAYLGLNSWHAAVVIGQGDAGIITFGWPVTGWDVSAWGDPVSFGQQQDPDSRIPLLVDSPPGWPDPQSEWLWTQDLTESGGRTFHPEGTCYFRRTLRDSGRDYNGPARVFVSATNRWDCWWEGEHVADGAGHTDVRQFDVEFVSGEDYTIGFKVRKDEHPEWSVSPGLLNMTIVTLTGEDELGSVLYRTYTDAVVETTPAPGPWKVLDYTDPDGLTFGDVAIRVLDEAKNDRGAIPNVTTDVDFPTDTDGATWSTTLPIVSYRDGEQVGEVLRQACQQFAADMQLGHDLVFHGYDDLGSDLSATVQLTDATPAAAAATLTDSGDKANTARVEVDGEFGWVGTPTGQRRETSVTLGLASTVDEIATAVEETLKDRRGRKRQVVTSAGPSGARPYTDYTIGDSVGVRSEDGGAYEPWQVASIAVVDLPGGEVEFDLDVEKQVADE